ncbi:MAG: hypothetical protein MI919_12930 [Holophagales bacterium]|nr:hypothetical protein [Holophagales bacterium]
MNARMKEDRFGPEGGAGIVVAPKGAIGAHPFPRLRWLAAAWLAVYLPSYTVAYGLLNFLFLCNLGVMLTAIGWIAGSRLLVSSQAVAAPVIGLAWALDAGWRVLSGDFLFGGTAYMWDPQYPLFTRLLSLYHLAWPLLVVWCVAKVGYDRRGWALQTVIAAFGLIVGRTLGDAELNINFAFRDPIWSSQIGPGPVHLLVVLAVLSCIVYGLTHHLLQRAFASEPTGTGAPEPVSRGR